MRRASGWAVVLAILSCSVALLAEKPDTSVTLPLPKQVSEAKKVCLLNVSGNDIAFDAFFAAIKQWGRFQIVMTPAEADLVYQFKYTIVVTSQNVWKSQNMQNGAIETVKTDNTEGLITLIIYEPKDKNVLGAITQSCKNPRREKSKQHEIEVGVEKLLRKLKDRLSPAGTH